MNKKKKMSLANLKLGVAVGVIIGGIVIYLLIKEPIVLVLAGGFSLGFLSGNVTEEYDRHRSIAPLYGGVSEKETIAKQREEDAKRKGRMRNER